MALTWPRKKVALEIVDNPGYEPFDESGWTVVRVTNAQLEDYDSCRKIMAHVAELLGSKAPSEPGWEDKSRELHDAFVARGA